MANEQVDRFIRVEFRRFKAFERFRLDLKQFNVIVGPNNAGKSTVIGAFRILAEAMRKATSKRAEAVPGPNGRVLGHSFDLRNAFVAEENIFYDYRDEEPAEIVFTLQNGNTLTLYFPEREACFLIPNAQGKNCVTPTLFKKYFNCRIGFAPILSPVDHYEKPFQKEAARRALLNYQASRNFRNIWHHFPEKFERFRELVERTWPGMSIKRPEVAPRDGEAYLFMYCPEHRKDREIFWSGFGFQVWCQMLTHIVQADESSIFLIDEPDVYLHSDLQRQLVEILKNLGPDILVATHSTEIIAECDTEDIVLVSKDKNRAKRLRSPMDLGGVFSLLGSSANPVLTQLAKTRRVLFVEGLDFKLLGQFARKMGKQRIAVRSDFAVVATEGFNPEKVRSLKEGMEHPLGRTVLCGVVLDRDYRAADECRVVSEGLAEISEFCQVHERKEIENFVLIPSVIDRLIRRRIEDRRARGANVAEFCGSSSEVLQSFCDERKTYIFGQFVDRYRAHARKVGCKTDDASLFQQATEEFEGRWKDEDERLKLIPGKEALGWLNSKIQPVFKVSVSASAIVETMRVEEIPAEMRSLIDKIEAFASTDPPN
ncbi:AAA family ATPase [Erythrobacter sp. SCSIO 43205]|uniref:ATP-dependent nuclease n=1 Tax=Erythrobacter sp. SCSIO 43205 TaxID=2779361 RepID=UPI001CAA31C4|nr:ATP-binding protein [Erythrobacter sp. SCSIO 43205]UAB77491.1 AAA family ATPase [Erythrobacter sp. SCSIO 43205]